MLPDQSSGVPTSSRVLIIAYGNPLRGDDGLAWRAADELEGKFPSIEVTILRRHQLAPELAEDLSRCAIVIFVDAASPESGSGAPGEVRVEEVSETESVAVGELRFSHQFSPATLVAMAAHLYRAKPRAFCVTLTGQNFEHGESLSELVEASMTVLLERIENLIQQFKSKQAL